MNYAAFRAGLCAAALLLFVSGNAHAIFRAYLSSTGNDANPCTLQQPCRVLPAALAAVDNGGEIWMLDSANYNNSITPVIITKSVTILAIPGALGSVIGIDSNSALRIDVPGGRVVLRNLVIRRASGLQQGVVVVAARSVSIENCVISGFKGGDLGGFTGLAVWAADVVVSVVNTMFRDNDWGTWLVGSSSTSISNCQFVDNGWIGVNVWNQTNGTTTNVAISDSVMTGSNQGLRVQDYSPEGTHVRVSVTRVVSTGNGIAFVTYASAGSSLVVSGSTATGNQYGLINDGSGVFRSTLDNIVADNTTADTQGVITPLAYK